MLRIGLVGFGKWGRNYVRSAIAAGNGQVTSVALPKGSLNFDDAKSHGLFVTSNLDALEVDAAIVATHPHFAPALCQYFFQRGIPVMVEKPAALSIEDGQKIIDTANTYKSLLLVAHQHLFATAYEHIRTCISDEKVLSIITRSGGEGPYRDYSALWDYGPHDISLIFGLTMSEPSYVEIRHQDTGDWQFKLDILFPSGSKALSYIWNNRLPKSRFLSVQTENSIWVYDDLDQEGRLSYNGTKQKIAYEEPLTRALRSFLNAVIEGGTDDYRFGADWAMKVPRWIALNNIC